MSEADVEVRLSVLPHGEGLALPDRATSGSAGWDLRAALSRPVTIEPARRGLIPTGIVLGLPPGYEAQVRPRSGRAWNDGLTVLNSPGTIDADYRGEVRVMLINLGQQPVEIRRGDRIAQLVIAPVVQVRWRNEAPDATARGQGGFGSSGR